MRQMLLKASSCHLRTLLHTITVVCAEVLAAEQALVDEEEFKATQAKLEAARMPAPFLNPPSDDTKLKGVLHGSINLLREQIEDEVFLLQVLKYAVRVPKFVSSV
ncbi:hypothetical protein L7F22_022555, partial [Adiantum nelumboides]|nr:hypothetical protein [Adiantum nelumboides]